MTIEEVGGSALYLLSDLSAGVTGEIHYVDAGYNIISMPQPDALKTVDAAETAAEAARRRAGEVSEPTPRTDAIVAVIARSESSEAIQSLLGASELLRWQ